MRLVRGDPAQLSVGETFPTLDRLEQIAQAAGTSAMWLAFGTPIPAEDSREKGDDNYAYIPLYDARVSAGHGSWTEGRGYSLSWHSLATACGSKA